MKFSEIANRLTGISTPVGGVSGLLPLHSSARTFFDLDSTWILAGHAPNKHLMDA